MLFHHFPTLALSPSKTPICLGSDAFSGCWSDVTEATMQHHRDDGTAIGFHRTVVLGAKAYDLGDDEVFQFT